MTAITMPPDNRQPKSSLNDPGQWATILLLAIAAVLAAACIIICYAMYGESFVRRRDDSVGEVLMREGMRLEASFMEEEALETYQRALQARFHGKQNRTFTQEQAGTILWQAGYYEKAADLLSRAVRGPQTRLTPYEGLVDSLIRLGEFDRAQEYLEIWNRALHEEETPAPEHGKAQHAAGVLAEAQQQIPQAMEIYEACVDTFSHAESAAHLAHLLHAEGRLQEAVLYFERYFLLGAPGDENARHMELYSQLLREISG